MSRDTSNSAWRPVAVWCGVTAAAGAAAVAVPGAWSAARGARGSAAVADLLVAVCAMGLALALAWLWAITTATVAGLLADRPLPGRGATRRLVLAACGVAVVAGTTVPATATGGDGRDLLVGLTLPERVAAPPVRRGPAPPTPARTAAQTTTPPDTYVVRRGDSLWSIALTHPDGSSVDSRWRAIWQANRGVVGDDPDLIIPGQVLRLPTTRTTRTPQDPSSDGDR